MHRAERVNWEEIPYIASFDLDLIACTCVASFVRSPEGKLEPDCCLRLSDVGHVSVERYHDPADATLGDFRGVVVEQLGERARYKLNTGDAIVTLEASTDPVIEFREGV